ncbi:MAG: DUF2309 domain-containing protein [Deltaproteobacteria bacterium]|nr:DUF2309 domain-containing protein [Deltaproteobacteria bacterium]
MGRDAVRARRVARAIEHAAHFLPAQGPISIFIHHNTLHAFEGASFENAVVEAGELFGCEPYLSEDRYRAEHLRGRIHEADIRDALERDLGPRGSDRLGGLLTRYELRLAALHYGVAAPPAAELAWLIEETSLLRRFRDDAPPAARYRVVEGFRRGLARRDLASGEQEAALRALWNACVRAAESAPSNETPGRAASKVRRADADELVHPFLVRVVAAFLDQGIAYWPMPGRDRGFYTAVRDLYGRRPTRRGDWFDRLSLLLHEDLAEHRSAAGSIVHSSIVSASRNPTRNRSSSKAFSRCAAGPA